MAKQTEITITFLGERTRRLQGDEYWIFGNAWLNGDECREILISGNVDDDELQLDQEYLLSGTWDKFNGKEVFRFSALALRQPYSRTGVIQYLLSIVGQLKIGFADRRCVAVWDIYGPDAIAELREHPERVAARLSENPKHAISADQARQIAAVLKERQGLEACTIEVGSILANRGFRKELTRWVIRDFGAEAADKIRENPFLLIKYPGCGFKNCDALWLELGLPAASLVRQAYCVWDATISDANGSTWIPWTAAEFALRSNIGSADLQPEAAIQHAIDAGLISSLRTSGPTGPISDEGNILWLADAGHAATERRLAELVADAMGEPCEWPAIEEIENIDGQQPEILRQALGGPIAILRGRPGTGKTFTAANVIKALIRKLGQGTVGIGAPTNIAAHRLNMAMAEYDVPVRARSNHSLLGMPMVRGEKWHHNPRNPFKYKVLVFDEESMKDAEIACAIFEARAKGTLVLLIGDCNQLPPVDVGAPLRDLVAAGLPSAELTDIRRNSGGIVEACAAIAEGRPWKPAENLRLIPVEDEQEQLAAILQCLRECRQSGRDPVWDSRVIVAKNETRQAINKVLQGELNPNPPVDGCVFRVNDKVICRENKDHKVVSMELPDEDPYGEFQDYENSNTEVRIANGEIGRVTKIGDKFMEVALDHPTRVVRVPLGKPSNEPDEPEGHGPKNRQRKKSTGTGCCWDLAYAVTFHSSQGSEFPWAICVASGRDVRMGSRELVYTGFSRAKEMCVAIGSMTTWNKFCRRVALDQRKTFLKEMILAERAGRELGEL
jgi:exodeoxyribonuclease V alpha subunit